jgi:hypothetical protein
MRSLQPSCQTGNTAADRITKGCFFHTPMPA